jgi:hypothetical protein
MSELGKMVKDCMTSANGDYDPARVVGYLIAVLAVIVFMIGMVVNMLVQHQFDVDAFFKGVVGLSALVTSVAGGVRIKSSTEVQPPKA